LRARYPDVPIVFSIVTHRPLDKEFRGKLERQHLMPHSLPCELVSWPTLADLPVVTPSSCALGLTSVDFRWPRECTHAL